MRAEHAESVCDGFSIQEQLRYERSSSEKFIIIKYHGNTHTHAFGLAQKTCNCHHIHEDIQRLEN